MYVLCGIKLGKLIWGVMFVLHQIAHEICLSLAFVKKKNVGGRNACNTSNKLPKYWRSPIKKYLLFFQ